jgi:hypothetical protein
VFGYSGTGVSLSTTSAPARCSPHSTTPTRV